MIKIIAIDQSLTGTACIYIEYGTGLPLKDCYIKTEKMRGVERLRYIKDIVLDFINSNIDENDEVHIVREGYSMGSRSSSVFNLGELGGILDIAIVEKCKAKSFCLYSIPPTSWKKGIFGNGSTKKDTAYLLKVSKLFNIDFDSDDEADSYMIAIYLMKLLLKQDIKELDANRIAGFLTSKVLKKNKITTAKLKKITQEEFDEMKTYALDSFLTYKKVNDEM